MKESIGSTQIFVIVVFMIFLFSGIMALTMNRSNSYAIKDEIVSIIERNGGLDLEAEVPVSGGLTGDGIVIQEIVDTINHLSYRQTGKCPVLPHSEGEVQGYTRGGQKTNGQAAFCITKLNGTKDNGTTKSYYYQVIVFYKLDLPILRNVFIFKSIGETKPLYS